MVLSAELDLLLGDGDSDFQSRADSLTRSDETASLHRSLSLSVEKEDSKTKNMLLTCWLSKTPNNINNDYVF